MRSSAVYVDRVSESRLAEIPSGDVARGAAIRADLRRAAPAVIGSWLGARALTVIGWLIARSDIVTAGRRAGPLDDALMSFDATFYRAIGIWGYPRCRGGDFACIEVRRFFPLYPAVGRVAAVASPFGVGVSLLIVANLAALVAGFVVWRLMAATRPEPGFASAAVVLLTLFPASSILPFAYAESLALVFTAGSLLALQAHRAGGSALGGVLSGLLRPTGVFVTVPVVVAWIRRRGSTSWSRWTWAGVAAAPALGVAAFHLFLGATRSDALAPVRVQGQLRGGFHEPVTRLIAALWRTATDDFRDAYNVAFGVGFIVLVALAATRYRSKVPVTWTVMAGVGVAVALSANNIDSFGRYGLAIFPAWLAVLTLISRSRRWIGVVVVAVSSVGYVLMTVVTMRGVLIP